jgi:hypothetical protein
MWLWLVSTHVRQAARTRATLQSGVTDLTPAIGVGPATRQWWPSRQHQQLCGIGTGGEFGCEQRLFQFISPASQEMPAQSANSASAHCVEHQRR